MKRSRALMEYVCYTVLLVSLVIAGASWDPAPAYAEHLYDSNVFPCKLSNGCQSPCPDGTFWLGNICETAYDQCICRTM
jgi:hypothetical protein